MSEGLVISFNHPFDSALHEAISERYLHDGQKLSLGYISIILPQFKEAYEFGISDTVHGVMQRSTLANNKYELPYNFGLLEVCFNLDQDETIAFAPFIPRRNLHLIDNPGLAAANFHIHLINDVNRSLEFQQSPFRLATIALQAV